MYTYAYTGLDYSWQPSAVEQSSKAMAAFLSTLYVIAKQARKKVMTLPLPLSPALCVLTCGQIVADTRLAEHVGRLHAVPTSTRCLIFADQGRENLAPTEASTLQLFFPLHQSPPSTPHCSR
jgi:hypothetical protein